MNKIVVALCLAFGFATAAHAMPASKALKAAVNQSFQGLKNAYGSKNNPLQAARLKFDSNGKTAHVAVRKNGVIVRAAMFKKAADGTWIKTTKWIKPYNTTK
jgi:hypothetical protein